MNMTVIRKYDYVYLLVLDLIARARVLRRPEIFEKMRNLPTEKHALAISADTVREALDDLTEEGFVRIRRADAELPPQFLLTPQGVEKWRQDILEVDAFVDGLRAIRKIFPSQRSAP